MNKKIKSDVFTFDENIAVINKSKSEDKLEKKEIDFSKKENQKKNKKENQKESIDNIINEDPFFFF